MISEIEFSRVALENGDERVIASLPSPARISISVERRGRYVFMIIVHDAPAVLAAVQLARSASLTGVVETHCSTSPKGLELRIAAFGAYRGNPPAVGITLTGERIRRRSLIVGEEIDALERAANHVRDLIAEQRVPWKTHPTRTRNVTTSH